MNSNDRIALLVGVFLLNVLFGIVCAWQDWEVLGRLSWSTAALLATAMLVLMLKSLFLGIYWMVWRRLPRKKMRRGGRTLTDSEAETVRLDVQKLIAEYQQKPRFNFVSASSEKG